MNFNKDNNNMAQKSSRIKNPANNQGYFPCTHEGCSKVFGNKNALHKHKMNHQEKKNLPCPYGCGKLFKRSDTLKNHIRIHTGELPFKCPIDGCNQSFRNKYSLDYHMRKHNGQTFFICENAACGKTFAKNSELKKHQRSSCVSLPKPKHNLYDSYEELDHIVNDYKGAQATKLVKLELPEEFETSSMQSKSDSTEIHSQNNNAYYTNDGFQIPQPHTPGFETANNNNGENQAPEYFCYGNDAERGIYEPALQASPFSSSDSSSSSSSAFSDHLVVPFNNNSNTAAADNIEIKREEIEEGCSNEVDDDDDDDDAKFVNNNLVDFKKSSTIIT